MFSCTFTGQYFMKKNMEENIDNFTWAICNIFA